MPDTQSASQGNTTGNKPADAVVPPVPPVPPAKAAADTIPEFKVDDFFGGVAVDADLEDPKPKAKSDTGELTDEEKAELESQNALRDELKTNVNSALTPVLERQRTLERLNDLNDFLSDADNKELVPYRAQLKKVVVDPRWGAMKLESIVYAVMGKELQRIGAAKEKRASDQSKRNSSPGTIVQPTVSNPADWVNLKGKDFSKWLKGKFPGARV